MSGNLKDYKEELEDFWESLPKKRIHTTTIDQLPEREDDSS